jgi:hypothetical protein
MVAKYYVALRPQTNEDHAVHQEGCPFMPDDAKRIYLGEFSSGGEAVSESHHHFSKTRGCLFCAKDNKVAEKSHLSCLVAKKDKITARLELSVSYHQSLMCCLN